MKKVLKECLMSASTVPSSKCGTLLRRKPLTTTLLWILDPCGIIELNLNKSGRILEMVSVKRPGGISKGNLSTLITM